MTDIGSIRAFAAALAPVNPVLELAISVCRARDQEPFEHILFAGFWMDRWQAVVAESLMLDAIRKEVLGNG